MNSSAQASVINQIPISNSTQILTASAQAPMNSVLASTPVVTASTPVVASTPIVASTPVVTTAPYMTTSQPVATQILNPSVPVAQPIMTSVVPTQQVTTTTTTNFVNTAPITNSVQLPEEDYRLGRGILDDFRPTPYNSKILVNSTVGVTPGVTVTTTTPTIAVGGSNLKDYL
jgi:deleted-in-malignant-brain-tumors protein 1